MYLVKEWLCVCDIYKKNANTKYDDFIEIYARQFRDKSKTLNEARNDLRPKAFVEVIGFLQHCIGVFILYKHSGLVLAVNTFWTPGTARAPV